MRVGRRGREISNRRQKKMGKRRRRRVCGAVFRKPRTRSLTSLLSLSPQTGRAGARRVLIFSHNAFVFH